jgi:Immunity protein 51
MATAKTTSARPAAKKAAPRRKAPASKAAPQKAPPKKRAPAKAPPKKAAPAKAAPRKAAPAKAPPKKAAPAKAPPKKAAPGKRPPKKAAPTEAVQAAPLEAAELFAFTDDDLEGLTFTLHSDKPDATAFAPGTLVEHDGGKYSLVYSTFPQSDDLEAVYGERGLQGGGHAWRSFVVHLMKQHAPAALEAIEFDPERTVFCAVSKDLAALRAVGAALAQLENVELVVNLARTVDVTDFD